MTPNYEITDLFVTVKTQEKRNIFPQDFHQRRRNELSIPVSYFVLLMLDHCSLNLLKINISSSNEGVSYKIKIEFQVQREIVTGLKYIQKTYRKGICVDKMTQMVGSYAPKEEMQSYVTPLEDAPSGLMARGHYTVKSLFTDDDGHEHLKWDWSFDIKKDWD
ncbi:Rho GDP-dissociation inhibitor 1 [Armadillidium vulgare]|nr:Rho GDP-dissociation inhibitor 1 [Armadillidium vulgare]